MEEPIKVSFNGDEKDEAMPKREEQPKPVKGDAETAPNDHSITSRRKNKFDDLDDYSLNNIIERLCIKDRFRLMRVNSRWFRIIHESFARTRELIFRDSFSLWDREIITADILIAILKRCPSVYLLDLCQTGTTLDDKTCAILRRKCPNLEKLICRDAYLRRYAVAKVGKACPNLKSVDFGKCNNVTEKGLWRLLNVRPRLEEISFVNCNRITGRCLYLCENLQSINLSGCSSFRSSSFIRLGQNCSGTLKTLIAPPLTTTGLEIICLTFPNLVHFEVDLPGAGLVSLMGASLLATLKNLETLIFRPVFNDLEDETFQIITSNLPKLTELYLYGTDYVTDYSVGLLADHCPNMRILNLEGFKFSDRTLRTFAKLVKLEQLMVPGSLISDEGANYIIAHLPNLELLGVNSCPGISLEVLSCAYDLVHDGLANKNLVICYNNIRIRIKDFRSKLEIRNYETSEIWGSMDFEIGFHRHEYDDDDDYNPDAPYDDDVIYDCDFDEMHEELT